MFARVLLFAGFVFSVGSPAGAQWQILDSGSTADLHSIDVVGHSAWASGADGTVLRTTDDGATWQLCAIPPGAEHLDFRGVEAIDADTAIVMSSGKGDLSRLYQTEDGCKSWELYFSNPDKTGFWVAFRSNPETGALTILGNPVNGAFRLFTQNPATGEFTSKPPVDIFLPPHRNPLHAVPGEAVFAASNSLFTGAQPDGELGFVTGGKRSEIIQYVHFIGEYIGGSATWQRAPLPFASGERSGAYSVARSTDVVQNRFLPIVVVGGDSKQPDSSSQTAVRSLDGIHFEAAQTPPHGFRSAVAYYSSKNYYSPAKAWITVGPNGTDISTDDGLNWHALKPNPAQGETPYADRNWNAVSLPFVVGPHGRIGKLRPGALDATRSQP
jgi:hypothetical protein